MSTQQPSRRAAFTAILAVTAVLIGTVTALTVAAATSAASPATTCAPGAIKAVVGGHTQCLKAGARCQTRFAAQYRLHGFTCVNGRLRKLAKKPPPPPPPPPGYPPPPQLPTGPATTRVSLPPATPLPSATTTIVVPGVSGSNPNGRLLAFDGAIWTASGPFKIDPATNAISGPFENSNAMDIGVGDGSVWLSDYNTDQVYRLDPATGKQIAVVKLRPGSSPEGITDSGGAIWVANHHGGSISRIDPQTNKVVATVVVGPPGSSGPQGIASGLGSVWVDVPNINSVVRIDPTTNTISAVIPFPTNMSPCGGVAVGQSAVWVSDCLDANPVARIDPATNKIASILDFGGEVIQMTADGNSVWFVASGDPDSTIALPAYLIHLQADDTITARYELPTGFITGGTELGFGSIWVSDFTHPRVLRIPQPN